MVRTYFNLSVPFCSTRVHSRCLVGFELLNHFCFQCTVLWILVIDCPFVVFICHRCVCHSSIYGFSLPVFYLQTVLYSMNADVLTPHTMNLTLITQCCMNLILLTKYSTNLKYYWKYITIIEMKISNLVHKTRFWNNLHSVSSNSNDWKSFKLNRVGNSQTLILLN
jgi:uncharacterized metal-binding protein